MLQNYFAYAMYLDIIVWMHNICIILLTCMELIRLYYALNFTHQSVFQENNRLHPMMRYCHQSSVVSVYTIM